jgi:hypothetical protein
VGSRGTIQMCGKRRSSVHETIQSVMRRHRLGTNDWVGKGTG